MKEFCSFHVILVLALAVTLAPAAEEAPTHKAASYKPGGDTGIDFQGTSLMPRASGHAVISNKAGSVRIDASFRDLEPARSFGTEFMTYVLWAVTPEGRVSNVGELVLDGKSAGLKASTKFQSFGLFVTAEPHFAVRAPSTRLVVQNIFPETAKFPVEAIDTGSSLSRSIDYQAAGFEPMPVDPDVPSEVYQARNAVRIAKWQKADKYAKDTWTKAQNALETAEAALAAREGRKAVVAAARIAVQTAEDARTMAVQEIEEEKAEAERRAAQERLAAEQQAAAERLAAEQRSADERLAAERRAAEERIVEERLAAERRAAEEREAMAQAQAKAAAEQRAVLEAQQAAARKLRADLMAQLNRVLETKDTDRGLMVSMAGVLFDTGKADLKPEAREKLAKLSGLMMANPTLRLDIEGHTDNTGSDETNEQLSLERAESVRDYLAGQGVAAGSMTAQGLGRSVPVGDNATAEGRQRNRRVEIIISGEAIGSPALTVARD